MENDSLQRFYFCLNVLDRKVVQAFAEFRIEATDERYVMRAVLSNEGIDATTWMKVDGAPDEMVSRKFDVYSMTTKPEVATPALVLFATGKLTEGYLENVANFVAHR